MFWTSHIVVFLVDQSHTDCHRFGCMKRCWMIIGGSTMALPYHGCSVWYFNTMSDFDNERNHTMQHCEVKIIIGMHICYRTMQKLRCAPHHSRVINGQLDCFPPFTISCFVMMSVYSHLFFFWATRCNRDSDLILHYSIQTTFYITSHLAIEQQQMAYISHHMCPHKSQHWQGSQA